MGGLGISGNFGRGNNGVKKPTVLPTDVTQQSKMVRVIATLQAANAAIHPVHAKRLIVQAIGEAEDVVL